MASLAVIWILVRVISLYNAADIASTQTAAGVINAAQKARDRGKQTGALRPFVSSVETRHAGEEKRGYQSIYITERSAGNFPKVEQPPAIMSGESRWQDSDDVRSFFLQASLARTGTTANEAIVRGPPIPKPLALHHDRRFAAYLWVFARQNSGTIQGVRSNGGRSISNGQYGGSQAGAILSYRLLDEPVGKISLYGRFSAALDPWSQQEVAMGARIQPDRKFAFALHAEQRFDTSPGGTSGTVFYVTGGTGPDRIVEKFTLETYMQGGYILGSNETYFFDGSATLQHPIAELGPAKLSVGPGAWAGGQRQISRLDLGPRIDVSVPLGVVSARIALDWRLRVAGDARPGNGAAITVSSGF